MGGLVGQLAVLRQQVGQLHLLVEIVALAQPALGVHPVELDEQVELLDLLGSLLRIRLIQGLDHPSHHAVLADVIRRQRQRLLHHALVRVKG